MATVTFTFGPKTKSFTVAAGSVTRFQSYVAAKYPDAQDPALAFIDGLWAGIKADVRRFEDEAAKAAVAPSGDLT